VLRWLVVREYYRQVRWTNVRNDVVFDRGPDIDVFDYNGRFKRPADGVGGFPSKVFCFGSRLRCNGKAKMFGQDEPDTHEVRILQ